MITKEEIESLGWVDQNDRGMSENYGYLFKMNSTTKPIQALELYFWTPSHDFWRGQRCWIKGAQNNANFYLKDINELKLVMEQMQLI